MRRLIHEARRWVAAAAWVACAGILAACGGGTGAGGEGATGTAAAPDSLARVLQADLTAVDAGTEFRGHGTWWNPAEPGTGFFFEAQMATGVVTFYVFDDAGRPVWYSGSGAFARAGGGFVFDGTLQRFEEVQTNQFSSRKTVASTVVGPVRITFTGETAAVELPGRSFSARKFFAGDASRAGTALTPETGIYWNAQDNGRGYTVEQQGGLATVGAFSYDTTGSPTWTLSVVPLQNMAPAFNSTDQLVYAGGQTLSGAFTRSPVATAGSPMSLSFGTACSGQLRMVGLSGTTQIKRFSFAGLSERDACRAWSTLPGAQTLSYGSAALPAMTTPRTAAAATSTVTFSLGLQEPQPVSAFTQIAAQPVVTLPNGGVARYRWVSGSLPAGVAFDTTTGAVRGVPTQAGEFSFEIALTVDGYGGQVFHRQTLVVRAPLVSYEGFDGRSGPLYATSFEVERLIDPRALVLLRDPATLQPLTLPAEVTLRFAVAAGSALPPGLRYDAAAQAVVGAPTTLTPRTDTVFEATLVYAGQTTRLQGTVPLRVDPIGALTAAGRVDYEALPVLTGADELAAQLEAQGARGFRFLTNLAFQDGRTSAIYARDASETYSYQVFSAAADAITLRTQLVSASGQGFGWSGAMGRNYELSVFMRGSASGEREVIAFNWPSNAISQLATQADQQGANGYAYAGHRTFSGQVVSLHEKVKQSTARYHYLASTEDPRTQSDFLARLNAQGARGLRLRPVEVPPVNLAPGTVPPRLVLLEQDTTQGATFGYSAMPTPLSESDFLATAAREGRTGGILAAAYLNLGLPGTVVFVRPLQCTGVICRPGAFMPQ